MLNDENACIRYLMKEMDPSEEVLMERAMMEDDDLLIEVECLRQTLKRLDELPDKQPSAKLTKSIVQQAAEFNQQQQSAFHFLSANSFKYAVAASVMLTLTLGGIWMYKDNSLSDNNAQKAAVAEGDAAMPILSNSFSVTPVRIGEAPPWVDKNEVIRFQDRFNKSSAEFDSMMKNSMHKLTPITDPVGRDRNSRSLQMTGTGN